MYDYRKWNREKQAAALKERVAHGFPLHSPPHVLESDAYRIITGACFEHKPILESPARLKWFEQQLLDHLSQRSLEVASWVVLPNHYHVLVKIPDIKSFTKTEPRGWSICMSGLGSKTRKVVRRPMLLGSSIRSSTLAKAVAWITRWQPTHWQTM